MPRRVLGSWMVALSAVVLLAQSQPATLNALAQRLVDSLTPAQQRIVRQDFDSSYRFDWNYVPRSRHGVPLANMNAQQKRALDALLRSALSAQGHAKAAGVIELEPILGTIEGSGFRDPGQYYVTIFGSPKDERWGWRFEGHHLSLNFTVTPEVTSATPAFFGANPAAVPSGPRADGVLCAMRKTSHDNSCAL